MRAEGMDKGDRSRRNFLQMAPFLLAPNNLATASDSQRIEQIRQTYREARQRLHRKMHEHGISP
jgi:hypothetical protein